MNVQNNERDSSEAETSGNIAEAVIESSNAETSPEIFKLDIDCLHEIFEYLTIHDLISVGKSCKHLQRMAGTFYQDMYASKRIVADLDGYVNVFIQFIPKLMISGNNLRIYQFVGANCKSVKLIRLSGCLPESSVDFIEDILKKVTTVEMNESFFRNDFFDCVLQHCHQLKYLSVKRSIKIRDKSIIIGTGNEWLCRSFPKLKHFELTEIYECNELITFFQLNPNVRTFSTDSESLLANRHAILASHAKLDKLAIEIISRDSLDSVYSLLCELHKNGLYTRLHIYSTHIPQEDLDRLFAFPLNQFIELMHGIFERIDTSLENLRVLGINWVDKISNIEILPSKMPNLEQLYFLEAARVQVLPFIRGSVNLKKIKIMKLVDDEQFFYAFEFPDLMELNKEREKLNGAAKVTIYANERLVLMSKWMGTAMELPLIELRRFESLAWNDLNAEFRNNHSPFYF